jgi:hypothetical protein
VAVLAVAVVAVSWLLHQAGSNSNSVATAVAAVAAAAVQ